MSLSKDLRDLRLFVGKMRLHSVGLGAIRDFRSWQRSLEKGNSPLKDEVPWINFASLKKLREILKPDFVAFEFGGGGSTLFLSKHVKQVFTVEHDPQWFGFVVEKMKSLGRTNWTGSIIVAEKAATMNTDYSNPDLFLSADDNYRGMSFEKYVTSIDKFPDEHFDFVMVDGRSRPSCLKHSFPKIKPGGFLLLDNSERDYYLSKIDMKAAGFTIIFNQFGPGPYAINFSQTTIWQKR